MRAKLLAHNLEPGELTPEEFSEFIRKQDGGFAAIIRQANIKVE